MKPQWFVWLGLSGFLIAGFLPALRLKDAADAGYAMGFEAFILGFLGLFLKPEDETWTWLIIETAVFASALVILSPILLARRRRLWLRINIVVLGLGILSGAMIPLLARSIGGLHVGYFLWLGSLALVLAGVLMFHARLPRK